MVCGKLTTSLLGPAEHFLFLPCLHVVTDRDMMGTAQLHLLATMLSLVKLCQGKEDVYSCSNCIMCVCRGVV